MYFYIKIVAKILLLLLGIDGVWLSLMGQRFYKHHLSYIFADNFEYGYAVVFYLLYAIAIAYFIVVPSLKQQQVPAIKVLIDGLLFGLTVYAAYDLTNQATIKNWPLIVTVVDMAWGSVLTGIVAFLVYKNTV